MAAMISRIQGEIVAVEGSRAEIRCGPLTHEVLVPASEAARLADRIGQSVELFTLEHLEAQGQGSSFVPRLIGFGSANDRAFFELFTTVKGVGNRKALRALARPFGEVAAAIAGRDVGVLKSLPEIGARTADTIVAELNGKVDRFIEFKPDGAPTAESAGPAVMHQQLAADAVTVLCQLGESAMEARSLVERVLRADPEIDSADAVVAAAYRLRDLP
jgi:Holliday junction DNA helicase RuvA